MKSCIEKIQLVVLAWTVSAGTVVAQSERVIWSKQDADPLLNVAFSSDGSILGLGRQDSNASDFLRAIDGSVIRSFSGSHNTTNDMVFTLDDQYLINGTGGGGSTLTLDLWRVSDGVRLLRLGAHTNGTHSVSLSPDGQYLVTSGRFSREIKLWHVPDLTLIRTIPNDDPQSPGLPPRVKDSAFSPDGQLIGSGDIYAVKLRRASDGVMVLRIPNAEVTSVAFSPNGDVIAGAVETENAVKVWRVADGQLLMVLSISTSFEFPTVAFSRDGTVIAAGYGRGNGFGALQFWSARDGHALAVFLKENDVNSIAFSPEPGVLAYTEYGGRVTLSRVTFSTTH
jgi:WD40 repeat protein